MRCREEPKFSISLNHTFPSSQKKPENFTRDIFYSNSTLSVYKTNSLIKITETGKKAPEFFFLGPEGEGEDETETETEAGPSLNISVFLPKEKITDYEKILDWNIPRVWLRRKYKNDKRWETLLGKIFLPFHQLNQIVETYSWKQGISYFLENPTPNGNFQLPKDIFKLLCKRLSKRPEEFSKRFSILICLLLRVNVSYLLYNETGNQKTRMVLQLFIDTHIDLINAISSHSIYDNLHLLDQSQNPEDFVFPLYEMCYPHDMRFFYCGDLPDLTSIVGLGGLWYSSDIKSGSKSIVHALIHVLSSKTQSYRCQGRNNMKILREDYFPKFPQMLELYKQFVRISLLGNYVFCMKRPSFEARMKICTFLNDASDFEVIRWMSDNELIVKYATKEYFDYLVKCTYSLDQIFSGEPTRQKVSQITINTMDDIRQLYSSFPDSFSGHSPQLQLELKKIYATCHNLSEPYISKLKKGRFDEVVFEACEKAVQNMIVNQNSTNAIASEKELDEEVVSIMEMIIKKHYIADKNPIGTEIDIRCFKMFGMSQKGYSMLKSLIYDYTFNDMADSAILNCVVKIYKTKAHDFYILHTFFLKLFDFYDSVEYVLPKQYADNQIKALRAKYRIHPWEDLPEYTGKFYYCEICKEWAHCTVTQITPEAARGVYAIGTENCLFDVSKQRLVCGNQPASVSIKRLKENGEYFEKTTESLKDAKIIRKYKTTEKCSDTPLASVNMIGRVKCLDGKLWALCQICASLTHFTPHNFGNLGFTCGCHDRLREEFVYLRHISRFDSGLSFSKICFYCGESSRSKEIVQIKVLDDMADFMIKELNICIQDFERCKHLIESRNNVVRKSRIFEIIKSTRVKSIESRMTKKFPRKP